MPIDAHLLDETLCALPLCQHPQCWASMRRLGRGRPRYRDRKLGSSFGSTSEDDDELPTLKTVTVPCSLLYAPEGSTGFLGLQLESSHDPFSYETSAHNFTNRVANFSLSKLYSPSMNSTRGFESSHQRYARCVSQEKGQKLDVIGLNYCGLSSYGVSPQVKKQPVVWVPHLLKKCQRQSQQDRNGKQTLRIGIQNLNSEIPGAMADCDRKITKRKKPNKVPTGGLPYNLPSVHSHHRYSRSPPESLLNCEIKGKFKQSFSPREGSPDDLPQQRSCTSLHARTRTPELQDSISPLLGNKKVVLHQTKERRSHVYCASNGSPCYKMDDKFSGSQKGMEIDVESIKNQPYLWKKYIDEVGPNGKIRVAGHTPIKVQQLDKLFTVSGGLGLFPSPESTSRAYRRKHAFEPVDRSMSSKVEEFSNVNCSVISGLATVPGESEAVGEIETDSLTSRALSLYADIMSTLAEEENHKERQMRPTEEQESVKLEADDNGDGGTFTSDAIDKPGKEHQREEHQDISAKPSNHPGSASQGPHPSPNTPTPERLGKEGLTVKQNEDEVEPAKTSH